MEAKGVSTFNDLNYLLPSIALMLAGSLALSCNKDKNGDGTLDVDEIIHIRNIHCEARGVKSLQGIEYLLELRGIYLQDLTTSFGYIATTTPILHISM